MIDPNAKEDLNKLINYGWASEDEVADIGRGLRTYIAELDGRQERLDKIEAVLNDLPTEIGDKYFKEFKSA